MRATRTICELTLASLAAMLAATVTAAAPAPESAPPALVVPARYVVQAATVALARQDVQRVGGTVERDLEVISMRCRRTWTACRPPGWG